MECPVTTVTSQWSSSPSNANSNASSHRRRHSSATSTFHGCDAIAETSLAHCSLDVTVVTVVLALSADAMASTTRGARSFGTGCVRERRGGESSVSVSRLVGCWSIRGSLKDHNGEGFRVVRTAGWASSDAARAEILPA